MVDENTRSDSTKTKSNNTWHRLLARLLEMVLSEFEIDVQPNVQVMTDPPEVDILLLRRKTPNWTADQRAHLPDGIRDSDASDILIEFKYTQSFNEKALTQAIGYDFFYKTAKKLPAVAVQTVLLSAKKPHSSTLTALGYQPTDCSGVYRTTMPVLKNVLLLSLNELSDEPHNLWIKCFASRKTVKKQAFNKLNQLGFVSIADELEWFLKGLMSLWFSKAKGEEQMSIELTPEYVTELGKQVTDIWLSGLTVDDMLARFGADEVLSHFKPEEVFSHFKPVERLAGLEPEVIEEYLKQLKKQSH